MKNTILTSIFTLFGFGVVLYSQNPCGQGTININGQDIAAVFIENDNYNGLNLPLWLDAGSTVQAGNRVHLISVIEFNLEPQSGGGNTLVFNRVFTIGNTMQTVPNGKVWKIEAISKFANPFTAGLTASSNAPICFGDNLNLTSSVSGATYAWTGPAGFSSSIQNPTINNVDFTNAGMYHLTATHNGCTYSDSVNVVINPLPAATFTNTQAIENYASTFTPTVSGATYAWTFASGSPATSNAENPQVTWTTAGSYQVNLIVTDGNGCSSTTQQNVTVSTCLPNLPQSDFSWSSAVAGSPTTFSPDLTGETYSWSFTSGSPGTSTAQNPSVTWANDGTYNVTLTVYTSTACYTTTQAVTVVLVPSSGTQTFTYTGGIQTFAVQPGITYHIECWGADGGNATSGSTTMNGGKGGYSTGDYSDVVPATLNIYVGGHGGNASGTNVGGGGGGMSDVTTSSNSFILVAGGGAGATSGTTSSERSTGGDGGGLIGGTAIDGSGVSGGSAATGGTQSAGGSATAGIYGVGNPGGYGYGGGAANGGVSGTIHDAGGSGGFGGTGGWNGGGGGSTNSGGNYNSGGGGAGYYGGGGGRGDGGAGGGGSSYIGGVNNGATYMFGQSNFVPNPDITGNGTVIISW